MKSKEHKRMETKEFWKLMLIDKGNKERNMLSTLKTNLKKLWVIWYKSYVIHWQFTSSLKKIRE